MWHIIRIFVAAFVALETLFAGIANGVTPKGVQMPETVKGTYTKYVDPFIGTGGTPWTCGMVSPAASAPFWDKVLLIINYYKF